MLRENIGTPTPQMEQSHPAGPRRQWLPHPDDCGSRGLKDPFKAKDLTMEVCKNDRE